MSKQVDMLNSVDILHVAMLSLLLPPCESLKPHRGLKVFATHNEINRPLVVEVRSLNE